MHFLSGEKIKSMETDYAIVIKMAGKLNEKGNIQNFISNLGHILFKKSMS